MKATAFILVSDARAAQRRVVGMGLLERVVRTAAAGGNEVVITGNDPTVVDALPATLQARFEPLDGIASALEGITSPVTLWLAHCVYDRRAASVLREHAAPLATVSLAPALLWTQPESARAVLEAPDPQCALIAAAAAAPKLSVTEPETAISIDASTEAGAAVAVEALWQSCRKPVDGFMSRNLNRYVSLAISRRIVDTAITPNHVSALCIVLGLLSGVLAAQGGYAYLLAGATLFKLNSILDGVDGELARVRWAYSKVGELLDSAGDNVANFSFFGGITVAAHRAGQQDLATAGLVGLSLWALYLVFLYSRLSGSGRGDVMTVRTNLDELRSPVVQGLLALGRKLLRRDSFVMASFLAAAFGVAPYLLLMILAGGSTVFTYAVLHFAARSLQTVETVREPR